MMKGKVMDMGFGDRSMPHDPGRACSSCGMPEDLCACDAMDQCEEDYCREMDED